MMKIAIPLDENREDVCVSFGRAPFFLFWQDGQVEILENPAAEAQGGAGIQAAQFAVDQGAQALVTVRCGQNAADVLLAADVRIYRSEGSGALQNAQACAAGQLAVLDHFHPGFHGAQ